jgi:hypothetical protein
MVKQNDQDSEKLDRSLFSWREMLTHFPFLLEQVDCFGQVVYWFIIAVFSLR